MILFEPLHAGRDTRTKNLKTPLLQNKEVGEQLRGFLIAYIPQLGLIAARLRQLEL